jgi:hypothetical protein
MHLSADVLYSKLLVDLDCVIDTTLPGWSVDSSVEQVFCYCLRDSLLRKFDKEDRPSAVACAAALDKFKAVNNACASWIDKSEFTKDEELLGEVKHIIEQFWLVGGDSPLVSDFRTLYEYGRAGPGASISARGTDFYTKMFDSPLSSTKGLPEIWEQCVLMDDRHFLAEARRLYVHGHTVVDSSKYSFVNKTVAVARGICTEPTTNMWFQLGLGCLLERRLKTFFGIDLATQPDRNRVLASVGSTDGSCSTIDLESASDSMALGMLKAFLPASFYEWLCILRCPSTITPTGERLELNMVSTMGNGFTFPLQTMLFSAAVTAVARWHHGGHRGRLNATNFGVFGDDIICPTEYSRDVLRVLKLLGFTVNSTKSFVEGPFRESCGADFFCGVNVRGVYIKSLNTQQDLYVAINALNRWSARSGVYLPTVQSYLASGLRRIFYVPLDEADDAGLHTPFCYRPKPVVVRRKNHGVIKYTHWSPVQDGFYVLGGIVWTFKEQVRRMYNPEGLLLTLLYGSIRGCRVLLRQKRTRYIPRQRVTPRWDHLPPQTHQGLYGPDGFRRFVDAWHWNLLGSSAFRG